MEEKPKVTCDKCGANITTTGNREEYRLTLDYEPMMPWYAWNGAHGGAVTDMVAALPIARKHHFCDMTCLREWAASVTPKQARAFRAKA